MRFDKRILCAADTSANGPSEGERERVRRSGKERDREREQVVDTNSTDRIVAIPCNSSRCVAAFIILNLLLSSVFCAFIVSLLIPIRFIFRSFCCRFVSFLGWSVGLCSFARFWSLPPLSCSPPICSHISSSVHIRSVISASNLVNARS